MITETKTFTFTDDGTTGTDTVNKVRNYFQGCLLPVNFTITGIQAKWTATQIQNALAQTNCLSYNSSTQIFTYTPNF